MKVVTRLMLLLVGAGAVVVWRNQQAREKASQAFDMAKERFQDVTASLPIGGQEAQTTHGGQPQRSVPTTTTTLSQTKPDAGISTGRSDATEQSSGAAGSTTRRTQAERAVGGAAEADTTHASDEQSSAQSGSQSVGAAERDGSLADIPADSLAAQSRATASELVQSSHQPDSMEVSESSEQTHSAAEAAAAQRPEPPSAAAPPQPASASSASTFKPANDPDAGQLDADGEDRTITDRVRTQLGEQLDRAEWAHVNINTQALGAVYLRGYVESDELRSRIEQIVSETEGVESVVNELNVEQQGNE